MRLALGTVQFGLDYGVSNRAGEVPDDELDAILTLARKLGVDTLDTAQAYGKAETRLGSHHTADFQLVGKLAPGIQATEVATSVAGSLQRLARPRLDGLLLHRSQDASPPCSSSWQSCSVRGWWARWGSPSMPPRSWHSGWRRVIRWSWYSSPPTCSISVFYARAGSTDCRLWGVRSTCALCSCKACC